MTPPKPPPSCASSTSGVVEITRQKSSPRRVMEAIDAAVEMIERVRDVEVALREIAWSNDSKWQADRARSVLEKSK